MSKEELTNLIFPSKDMKSLDDFPELQKMIEVGSDCKAKISE